MASFVRSVELGGFSAAARELGMTPSALSKLVTRLEDRLGVRLLNRTTRKLALTPEGGAYFARCQHIISEIEEAEAELTRFRDRPRGLLRVSVGTAFGMHQLVPAVPRFFERYPEIRLELSVSDRRIDMMEEGADLAIRIGSMADSSLVARKICDLERTICASPAYLERNGTPRVPEDLVRHNCLYLSSMPELARWPFDTDTGPRIVEASGSVGSDSAETLLQLAVMGVGIIRLADIIVGAEIARGTLVPILVDCHHVEPLPMYVVYPQGRHRSPKVVAMVDFLIENFAGAPWRTPRAPVARGD
jgi:DNA-binding transcriptional LysR family regulator